MSIKRRWGNAWLGEKRANGIFLIIILKYLPYFAPAFVDKNQNFLVIIFPEC